MGELEHNGVNVPCLYDIAISCRAWCLSLIPCSYPLYDCFIYNVNIIVSATQFCNFQIYICFLTVLMTVTKFQIFLTLHYISSDDLTEIEYVFKTLLENH